MPAPVLDLTLPELRATRTSVKWSLYGPEVLPLWVAEMDARPCEPVVAAVRAALERGDTGYAWSPGFTRAFAAYAARSWGWAPDPAVMTVMGDVMVAVAEVLRLVTEPGGPVVISPPVYNCFPQFVEAIGRRCVTAPLTTEGRLDAVSLREAFTAATAGGERAAYLLCNPQNPVGVVHTAEELTMLAGLAAEFGVRVISDEIHAPLVFSEASFTPYPSLPGTDDAFTVFSPSKGWNLAGLRAALVVPGPAAVDDLRRLPEVLTHGAMHLGVLAQTVALDEGGPWMAQLLTELDANRRLLATLVDAHLPGVRYRMPSATYLGWLDLRAWGLGEDPSSVIRDRCGVAFAAGHWYGEQGRGFVRVNFATSPPILTEAIERLATLAP